MAFESNGSPQPGFNFGAGTPTPKPAPKPTPVPFPPPAPSAVTTAPPDQNNLLDIFARNLQAKNQLATGALHGRHLGIGGGEMSADNPGGEPGGSPWAGGGLFHGGFASQMSPEALAKSSGSTAVNQWNGLAGPNAAPPTDAQKGTILSPGVGQFGTGGERAFMGPQGRSTEYDPRYDRYEGLSGILSRYDPAINGGGKPGQPPPTAPAVNPWRF